MSDGRTCTGCGLFKPWSEFPLKGTSRGGRAERCKSCKVETETARKAKWPEGRAAAEARAVRAGIRLDKCAVCGTSIQGRGVCVTCEECIEVLGGLDGLKRAVRAQRWLDDQE